MGQQTSTARKASAAPRLGRLKSFGLEATWQAAFLLPRSWQDLSAPISDFSALVAHPEAAANASNGLLLRGELDGTPEVRFRTPPMLLGHIRDANGLALGFSEFGDTRELQQALQAHAADLILHVQAKLIDDERLWLSNPTLIPREWVGHMRPVYPGLHRVIKPDTVRERVLALLDDAIPEAASWLLDHLLAPQSKLDGQTTASDLDCRIADMAVIPRIIYRLGFDQNPPDFPGNLAAQHRALHRPLCELLRQAHLPRSMIGGRRAHRALDMLGALGTYKHALANRPAGHAPNWHASIDLDHRLPGLPFPLTEEQMTACREITSDLAGATPMRRILSGDVGTGKTAVYGMAAASAVDAGARVAILLPSQTLAAQVYQELTTWWPDLMSTSELVIAGATPRPLTGLRLLVGTTSLLTQHVGMIDLLIVDEQHRFSRDQREALGGPTTHLLEVTATCIPRTQALMRYGVIQVSKLTQCHVDKDIRTTLYHADDRKALFDRVRETLERHRQVLVIHPTRSAETKKDGLPSAEAAFQKWEALFPGQVRLVHGQMDTNAQSLDDMRHGRANILVATTVVEVGIDLPLLERVLVVHAERFGLTALHQIRGRVARKGGVGYCDLYLPREVGDKSIERLQVLESMSGGFEVAEADLALRGFGDLSSNSERQTGADETFLFGRGLDVKCLDQVISVLA